MRGETMNMRTILIAAAVLVATGPVPAGAAEVLSGKDAAYIDWAARNCGMRSTPKEHGLVEAARAKGVGLFEKQYMQQYEDKRLAEALSTPSQTGSMCDDIKSWYGRSGSIISDLVQASGDPIAATPSGPGAAFKAEPGGKGGGGKRR